MRLGVKPLQQGNQLGKINVEAIKLVKFSRFLTGKSFRAGSVPHLAENLYAD